MRPDAARLAVRSRMDWHEEPISHAHRRADFDCGVDALNAYLHQYARQNHANGGAKTYVAVPADDPTRVVGYYSIAPGLIEFEELPSDLRRQFGRYPIPVFVLARLAVEKSEQGHGLGTELLLVAGVRALRVADEVGGFGLLIEAKNAAAAVWYQRLGAIPLTDSPLRLVLPFSTIARAVAQAGLTP